MALRRTRFFDTPNRRSPAFQYGVLLFIQPGDHTQRVRIERAPDSAGSPGTYVNIATAGPFPRGGGYYFDERPNTTGTWWYRARHEAGSQYGSAGAYLTIPTAVSPRLITDADRTRLGNDSYPSGQGSVDIEENGNVRFNVDGASWVKSWRWSSSTAGFPSEATVLASGTTTDGRQINVSHSSLLPHGSTITATFIPFSGLGATGSQGPSIQLRMSREGEAVPQGTVSIKKDGSVEISIDGQPWVASYKYATSTAGFPSDATARAGTTVNGRQVTVSLGAATLNLGDTIYATFLPYSATAGGGEEGASIRMRATRHDASATKTVFFGANAFTPAQTSFNVDAHLAFSNAYVKTISSSTLPANINLVDNLQLPEGVTVTNVSYEVYTDGTYGRAEVYFYRTDASGARISLGSATHDAAGWATKSLSMSESTTGRRYQVVVVLTYQLIPPSYPATDEVRVAGYSVTYSMPSTANTL